MGTTPGERHGILCTGGWVGLGDGLSGHGNLAPTGIGSTDLSARNESLYPLYYLGRHVNDGKDLNFGLNCHKFTQTALTNQSHVEVVEEVCSVSSASQSVI